MVPSFIGLWDFIRVKSGRRVKEKESGDSDFLRKELNTKKDGEYTSGVDANTKC